MQQPRLQRNHPRPPVRAAFIFRSTIQSISSSASNDKRRNAPTLIGIRWNIDRYHAGMLINITGIRSMI
jgi:hypothetical protein